MRRNADRAPLMHPGITVDYVRVIDRNSKETVQVYVQPSVGATEDLLDTVLLDWPGDDVDLDPGTDKLNNVLRGGNLQDAQRQLAYSDTAVVDTFSPRMRAIPKLTTPSRGHHADPKQGVTAMLRKAAMDYSTEGLLTEMLGLLGDSNDSLQKIAEIEQGIHEAKADGEPVSGVANEVISLMGQVGAHFEEARNLLLKRLDVFLGKAKGEKEASVKTAGVKRSDKKVVAAFLEHEAATGGTTETDGSRLWLTGMGGADVAWWDEGYLNVIDEYSSRSEQALARYIRKVAPEDAMLGVK